jgi:hypothetical protein
MIVCKIMLKCNKCEGIADELEVKQSEMVAVK